MLLCRPHAMINLVLGLSVAFCVQQAFTSQLLLSHIHAMHTGRGSPARGGSKEGHGRGRGGAASGNYVSERAAWLQLIRALKDKCGLCWPAWPAMRHHLTSCFALWSSVWSGLRAARCSAILLSR